MATVVGLWAVGIVTDAAKGKLSDMLREQFEDNDAAIALSAVSNPD